MSSNPTLKKPYVYTRSDGVKVYDYGVQDPTPKKKTKKK